MATEKELRNQVATWMNQYKGIKEGSSAHKAILAIFNNSGLCSRYKMTTSDAWCMTAVSAAFIDCGLASIFPCVECSCGNAVTLAKSAGIWVESDSYTPGIGDVLMYDWDDSGSGDCTGWPDHVGIVQKVSGTTITVIEGNKSDTVATRTMTVNGRYIRGYITPNFAKAATGESSTNQTEETNKQTTETKSVDEIAAEVIAGAWGNGDARKSALTAAGYNYDEVQAKVNELLGGTSSKATQTTSADEQTIWDYLMSQIGNAYGVAGLMGNLYAESALIANNLQNTYNTKLGMTDKEYTDAVDNGSYTKFSSDSAGYGLAQWTYSTRKKALKSYADGQNASIGNLQMQLEFLVKEMSDSFSSVLKTLKSATSVKTASDAVLTKYEMPADQSSSVKTKRAGYGQTYYDKFVSGTSSGTSSSTSTSTSSGSSSTKSTSGGIVAASKFESGYGAGKKYKVTPSIGLNIRKGPSTSYDRITALSKGAYVMYYGYYDKVDGVKWRLVITTSGQTGWACGTYLTAA